MRSLWPLGFANWAAVWDTLEGQIKASGSYTTGNLCAGSGDCWAEGDNVPARLTIQNLDPGTVYSVVVQHDFLLDGVVGYESFHTPSSGNDTASLVTLSAPTSVACAGRTACKSYTLSFKAEVEDVQLDWFARLGDDASLWSGSSLHFRLL